MIIGIIKLWAAPEHKELLVSAIRTIATRTEGMPGCRESALYLASGDEGGLLYLELWESNEDMQRHLKTDNYRKLLSLIELSVYAPVVSFFEVVLQGGIERVVEARQPKSKEPQLLRCHPQGYLREEIN